MNEKFDKLVERILQEHKTRCEWVEKEEVERALKSAFARLEDQIFEYPIAACFGEDEIVFDYVPVIKSRCFKSLEEANFNFIPASLYFDRKMTIRKTPYKKYMPTEYWIDFDIE